MKKWLTALALLGSAFGASLCGVGPALAAPDQVFVDPNVGLDGNPCTETSPCQTLQHAASVVADPGTITVLSSGILQPITITTGLTITCPRITCIIDSSANANGTATTSVTISAPGKDVHLSGVSISGYGTGLVGISVTDVAKLLLTNVSVSGEGIDISFTPSTASATSHMEIVDSDIRNASNRNIKVQPTSSNSASVLIRNSTIHHSNNGLYADATTGTGGVSVVIMNSFLGFQNNSVINANGNSSGAPARVLIDSSALSYSSGTCITSANATATVALTKTQVTQCTTALNATGGGGIFTYGDNAIHFNTSDGSTPTTAGGFR